MRNRLLIQRSSLLFPAGRTLMVNTNHPAYSGIRMACATVSTPGINTGAANAPFNLLGTGTFTAQTSLATRANGQFPGVGPAYAGFGGNSGYSLAGQTVETLTSVTYGFIALFCAGRSPSPDVFVCNNSSVSAGTGGFYASIAGASTKPQIVVFSMGGTGTSRVSTLVIPIDRSVFIAGSVDGSTSNFVCTDLTDGQITSSSTTGLTFAVNDGTVSYGGVGGNHLNLSYQGAGMFSAADLTMDQLLTWARNPWSFWYNV
jgi:hypothetical protein